MGWLSLGDYLVSDEIPPQIDRKLGLGLVGVNAGLGEELLSAIEDSIQQVKLEKEPAKKNLRRPEPLPGRRKKLEEYGIAHDGEVLSDAPLRRPLTTVVKSMLSLQTRHRIKKAMNAISKLLR